tara:strand:+ start:214 stop:390 length:177 start_codon:yes stop_codon:yes gene_type:complete
VKIGDKVKMEPMWKYDSASGEIINITESYIIVKWIDIPGDWHYTIEQAKKLELCDVVD